MGGLCAAARARELGLDAVVLEKGDRAGGSMLLSSGVIWRHRTLADFRAECPGGDETLQATVMSRLDGAIAWLESLGATVRDDGTGNPRTVGKRFDPRSLTDALVGAAGCIRLRERLDAQAPRPLVLATGGFAADLARRKHVLLRANRWSEGDGLRYARDRGAATAGDLEEFYGRNMPAPPARVNESAYVAAAQLYGRLADVVNEAGRRFVRGPISWSETDLVQAIARQPGGTAWYAVDARTLDERVRDRTVAEMIAVARSLGGPVRAARTPAGLGVPGLVESETLREAPFTAVRVIAGITHTLGGLRIDPQARVLTATGAVPGLYACGADVGGISSGGYSSGLAAALVFGRLAAETAAAEL
jgi:succinate dehydrogenase/fumarate reductase flavoprotein subunit